VGSYIVEVLAYLGFGHGGAGSRRSARPNLFALSSMLLFGLFCMLGQTQALAIPKAATRVKPLPPQKLSHPSYPLVYCFHGKVLNPRLVVVDKSRQRVMVFRYLGKMALEYEFPTASGEQKGKKTVSKDERTPEGVYFITHRYKDSKITIFGDRAMHLNYPNPSDILAGRKGDGIYIHGSNRRYKPRSTNGCLVMDNQDIARVEPLLKEQSTPVIVVDRLELPVLAEREKACEFLRTLDLKKLSKIKPELPQHLSLVKNQVKGVDSAALAEKLGRLGPKVRIKTHGLALWGVGEQWVLVAHQSIKGPRKKTLQVSRRFYLQGPDYAKLKVVQSQWVLPDIKQAKLLASWAPPKPVVVAAKPASKAKSSSKGQIKLMVDQWLAAWQAKRLKEYMSFYARDFRGSGKNKRRWRRYKAHLNKAYKTIEVKATGLKIKVKGNWATVRFVQHYRSDWHKDLGVKTLQLVKRKGRWQIRRENWRAIKTAPKKRTKSRRS
jgi:murein L,D-transpeptidase YafK